MLRKSFLLALVLVAVGVSADLSLLALREYAEVPGASGSVTGQIYRNGPFGTFVSSDVTHSVYTVNPFGEISVIAGAGSRGFQDGDASIAKFSSPRGLALGPSGEVFVADYGNHALRVIANGQVSTVTTNLTAPTYLSAARVGYVSDDDDDDAPTTSSIPAGIYVQDRDDLKLVTIGPANDNCDNAIDMGVMTGSDKFVQGNNNLATGDSAVCYDDDDDVRHIRSGVWYTFVGNGHQATISTCGHPTDFDTMIFVFRADEFNAATCDPTRLQCVGWDDDGCSNLASSITICTQQNMRYYVVVSGYGSHENGQFALNLADNGDRCSQCSCSSSWECGSNSCGGLCSGIGCSGHDVCRDHHCQTRASNAECSTAQALSAPVTLHADTNTAIMPAGVPAIATGSCRSIHSMGLWYTMVGNGQRFTANTCGPNTNFDTVMELFSSLSSCTEELTCIGFNDDSCGLQSELSWCSVPSIRYYVLVAGYGSSDSGVFDISFRSENDDRCRRTRSIGSAKREVDSISGTIGGEHTVVDWHAPLLSAEQRKEQFEEERKAIRAAKKDVRAKSGAKSGKKARVNVN